MSDKSVSAVDRAVLADLFASAYQRFASGKGVLGQRRNLVESLMLFNKSRLGPPTAISENDPRGIPLDELNFPPRVRNCMNNMLLNTAGLIADKTDAELLRIPNFGRDSLSIVTEKLAALGLR